jgi:peptidoglycan-associated lipoprotein
MRLPVMRKTDVACAFTLIATLAFVGCGGKKVQTAPPAPVAPEAPPPAPPPPVADIVPQENEYDRLKAKSSDELDRLGLLADIHFDFDKSDVRESDRPIINRNAEVLKKYDFMVVTVEGHCDSRGTVEYNLALGERRAKTAYDYLVSLGVPAAQLRTVSYGKEVPLCTEQTEDCWARNRRDHFAVTGKTTR